MKLQSFGDVTPHSLVDIYQRFGGSCCPLLALMMETAGSNETVVNICKTIQHRILENNNLCSLPCSQKPATRPIV
jgi:hypothetical protein